MPGRHVTFLDGGGRGGIRTRGALFRHAAFRERYHKPLGHPSAAQYIISPGASQAQAGGNVYTFHSEFDSLEVTEP
jgi:hypothetical protein